jgi:hypothetical protein
LRNSAPLIADSHFAFMHCSKTTTSFDHRIVEREQCRRRETDISTDQDFIAFVASLNYDVLRGSTVAP